MKGLVKVCSWSGHVERIERDKIIKRVCSVGWIDTMKDCLRKRGLDVRQARRMFQDRSEWWMFGRENAWGVAYGMNLRP